jgi:hypothetical protein
MSGLVPVERIEKQIYLLRGQKVMLSTDLAELYKVQPRVLVQAVKRNIERFPEDFMFQLTDQEFGNLKSQFVISSWGGLRRANPYARFKIVFEAISQLMAVPEPKEKKIGFRIRESITRYRVLGRKNGRQRYTAET